MRGLLDPEFWRSVNETASQNGLLGPYVNSLNQAAGLLSGTVTPREFGAIKSQQLHDQFGSPEGMMNFVPFAGMTAWHGSPHKFDKFKLDKIGTGEGAQAYGHGLYFAESPEVAASYAKKLSSGSAPPSAAPSLYKVDIADAAIPKMLDWDAPLSKQPSGVRAALADIKRDSGKSDRYFDPLVKGQEIDGGLLYRHLRNALGDDAAASAVLKKHGIPGIKYKDQGSRSGGGNTHNYVIFDDGLVRILDRQ